MKFDDDTIGSRMKDKNGCVAIISAFATFQTSNEYEDVEERILPLILIGALTLYKLQGTTVDEAVIDIGE